MPYPFGIAALFPADAELGFVNEVGAKHGDVLPKPLENRLTDTQRLDRFFVGTGEKVLIVRRGRAEHIPENMRKGELHDVTAFNWAGGTPDIQQM